MKPDRIDQILEKVHAIDVRLARVETKLAIFAAFSGGIAGFLVSLLRV